MNLNETATVITVMTIQSLALPIVNGYNFLFKICEASQSTERSVRTNDLAQLKDLKRIVDDA